jgi:peptidyl-prolyl cis-trans isomerase A (cyclophilin A)
MARITSKSKSRYRKGNVASCSRLILIGTTVVIIFLLAFVLYETDQVLFHSKYGKMQYDSVKKSMNRHHGQEVYMAPEVVVNRKMKTEDGAPKKSLRRQDGNDDEENGESARKKGDDENSSKKDSGESVDRQRVAFDLSRLKVGSSGTIVIETVPEWAPNGVRRFQELVKGQFYVDCRFFRVVPNFVAQFGIAASPLTQNEWKHSPIPDDPVLRPNLKYTVSFAMSGKNSRTTQLFINLKDNTYLDKEGFAPIGMVVEGQEFLPLINDEYREGPNQGKMVSRGNKYLDEEFPHLTFINDVRILDDSNDDQAEGDDGKGDDQGNNEGDDKGDGEEEKGEEEEENEEEQ